MVNIALSSYTRAMCRFSDVVWGDLILTDRMGGTMPKEINCLLIHVSEKVKKKHNKHMTAAALLVIACFSG